MIFSLGNRAAHGVILAVAITATVTIRTVLRDRYKEERRSIEMLGWKQRTREIATAWNSLTYAAADDKTTQALLQKIDWSTLELHELQRAKLESRLREILAYLQNPSFADYTRLKTEALTHKFEISKLARVALRWTNSTIDRIQNLKDSSVIREVWDAVIAKNEGGVPPRVKSVCLDQVAIATSRTNSPNAILIGKISKGFTVARIAIDPGFQYALTNSAPSAPPVQPLFVHVSFFVRSSTSVDAGPVHISLQWSEGDQEWILHEMFTDVLLRMELLF